MDSFYDLPIYLVNHIIKRLNIHQCLHAEQLLKREGIEGIDMKMIYKKNYLKLLLSNELQCYYFHCFNDSHHLNYCNLQQWYRNCILQTLNKPISFYRKICIQYLVEQWVKNNSQQIWTSSYQDYIKKLIKNKKEVIQELCLSINNSPIDPLILEEIGPIKTLTLKLNDVTPDSLSNTEILLQALMRFKNANPLEINFDINWNKIIEKEEDEDNDEIYEKREEQMEEIIHLLNKYFNQQYIDYSPQNYSNKNGML